MPACPVVYCGDLIPADHGIFDRHPEGLENTGSLVFTGMAEKGQIRLFTNSSTLNFDSEHHAQPLGAVGILFGHQRSPA